MVGKSVGEFTRNVAEQECFGLKRQEGALEGAPRRGVGMGDVKGFVGRCSAGFLVA
jgi:hypothetical protein